MRLERAVTGFATHGHFRHCRVVAVSGHVVILVQARVMAFGTERIPIHAPARPVAVFTRIADVVAIDVEPLI